MTEKLPEWLVRLIGLMVVVTLVTVAISQAYSIPERSHNSQDTRTMSIAVEGKVTATPDIVMVSTTIQNDAATQAAAQTVNNQNTAKASAYLKSQGIADADIQTTYYNLSPKYDYSSNTPKIVGYTASETFTVKVRDLSSVSAILAGLPSNGVFSIDSTNYDFANPDTYRQQALAQAFSNAQSQAQALASAAGVKLGQLVSFVDNSSATSVAPMPYAMAAKPGAAIGGSDMSAPTLEPGSRDVTADISVVYQIQ